MLLELITWINLMSNVLLVCEQIIRSSPQIKNLRSMQRRKLKFMIYVSNPRLIKVASLFHCLSVLSSSSTIIKILFFNKIYLFQLITHVQVTS